MPPPPPPHGDGDSVGLEDGLGLPKLVGMGNGLSDGLGLASAAAFVGDDDGEGSASDGEGDGLDDEHDGLAWGPGNVGLGDGLGADLAATSVANATPDTISKAIRTSSLFMVFSSVVGKGLSLAITPAESR